jgi:hypothetical protein
MARTIPTNSLAIALGHEPHIRLIDVVFTATDVDMGSWSDRTRTCDE